MLLIRVLLIKYTACIRFRQIVKIWVSVGL